MTPKIIDLDEYRKLPDSFLVEYRLHDTTLEEVYKDHYRSWNAHPDTVYRLSPTQIFIPVDITP